MQVFLSYDRNDEKFAKALAEQLEKHGLSVWKAFEEILPGENMWESVSGALKASRAMIVLLSPESLRSVTFASSGSSYTLSSFCLRLG